MIKVVQCDYLLLRLALDTDAVGAIGNKLESVKAELETWKSIAVDAAYEGAVVCTIGS